MRLSDPTDALSRQYDLPDQNGAVVAAVQPNSPAARAGLRAGDVITGINGQKITSADQARSALSKADPKKGIRFDVSNKDGSQLLFLRQG
jgi:serine protease Do